MEGSVREGLEVSDAIRAFAAQYKVSEEGTERMIECFEDGVVEVFMDEGIDPYAETE